MPSPYSAPAPPARLHRGARAEDKVHYVIERVLRRRGWTPRVVPYVGYGTDGWVRVLARVLLAPPGTPRREIEKGRGWRRFFCATATNVPVSVEVGGVTHQFLSSRGGYIDDVLDAVLAPGWATARLSIAGGPAAEEPIRVVSADARVGIVSDIDDTVVITAMPRPLLALWHTMAVPEASRRPVPGMAALYQSLLSADSEAFAVYLSTGAWNVAPALTNFLARHGFPRGPLLMTDWGPTAEGWFRSGRDHKRKQLLRLMTEFPQITWVFVGDDGQHDPDLYAEAVTASPGRVRMVLIRQLTAAQQVLTHGTPEPLPEKTPGPDVLELRGQDGFELRRQLP
ncbi:MAG: phosphatase domain-containing protein [Mycobacteriales bacterium]